MSDALDDGEFWLPPKFLTDEEDKEYGNSSLQKHATASLEFRRFCSDPSSPVDPMFGSTAGSDEQDELFNTLSRELARSSLFDSSSKKQGDEVSPQSTMYAERRGAAPRSGWDLLYAAATAEEEEMMARNKTRSGFYDSQQQHHQSSSTASNRLFSIAESEFYYQQALVDAHRQLQLIQLQRMKLMKQQAHQILMMRQRRLATLTEEQMRLNFQQQQQIVAGNYRSSNQLTDQWPQESKPHGNVNHPGGADMRRALFIGEPQKPRAGTGVFLPRRPGQPQSEPLRKRPPGCRTVLIPDRVVQALNLDVNATRSNVTGPARPAAPGYNYNMETKIGSMRYQSGNSDHISLPGETQ